MKLEKGMCWAIMHGTHIVQRGFKTKEEAAQVVPTLRQLAKGVFQFKIDYAIVPNSTREERLGVTSGEAAPTESVKEAFSSKLNRLANGG